jgi:Fe-S oxidoreductase
VACECAQQQRDVALTVRDIRRHQCEADAEAFGPADGHEVVLFADTFNRAYERENLDTALRVLIDGGYRLHVPKPTGGSRPLCCGGTFLSSGLVDQARAELDRLVQTYAPFAACGVPIIGLGPSCLLTFREELLSLRKDDAAKTISALALLFEEFLVREAQGGRLQLKLGTIGAKALVHGHCRQKSFGAFKPVEQALRLIPDLAVEMWNRAAAVWQAASAMALIPMTPLSRWPSCRSCRPCAAPMQRRSSSPTARHAGIRSRMVRHARPSTSRLCSP